MKRTVKFSQLSPDAQSFWRFMAGQFAEDMTFVEGGGEDCPVGLVEPLGTEGAHRVTPSTIRDYRSDPSFMVRRPGRRRQDTARLRRTRPRPDRPVRVRQPVGDRQYLSEISTF